MTNSISFIPGSRLHPISFSDFFLYSLQPFIQKILDRFIATKNLDMAIEEAMIHYPQLAETFFNVDLSNIASSFSLKQEFLFPEKNPLLKLMYNNGKYLDFFGKRGVEKFPNEANLSELHHLLYLCGQSHFTYSEICQQIDGFGIELLDKFVRCSIVAEQPQPASTIDFQQPGIFRLQHASLLYRTETTGILVDPHLHSNYGSPKLKNDINRAQLEGYVDAILISHSHYDHWHYPTLMMFSPETLIVVPKVSRQSIVCEDMEARLRSLGFNNVVAVDWNAEPIAIGDMEINVLPFYGEQILVPEYDRPKHPDLRNWGNTYLINTPHYNSWFLIDAGSEPLGSMAEVAAEVKQKFGRIDSIVSNFYPLSYNSIGSDLSAFGVDIVGNLLSNPQIFAVTNKTEGEYLATLGPKGVAEVCAIVEAKSCLPYAASWVEIGQPGVRDRELIQEVEQELSNLQCPTQVIPWKIGDVYFPR